MSEAGSEDFEDLYEAAPFGYLSLGPDGRIARANATCSDWLGYPTGALDGKRLRDLMTLPARMVYETNIAPVLRLQGGFEEVALDLLTATGEKLPVLVSAVEQRAGDGQVISTRVGVMRGKERRGYEQALASREAAAIGRLTDEREASELREQFIAVLGHDLRNPLASIIGAARLLRREGQSEKALKILAMMETSVDRMAGLIDDVMDFARGRLGAGIGVERTVAALEPVLRHLVEELEASNPSRDIISEFDLSEPVSVDTGRISQLVSNLLGNALTHGDPKSPVRLGAATRDGALRIWVVNAGPAIPAKAMERLFQPFFRGEVRASQQGLGLGLHIASEIARAHGGTLTVTSDETETRFILELPIGPSPAEGATEG
jgi:sigma-B regulation protein RsbU (phosphoserine phosphatase)